jgi:hypothetical protein
MVIGNVHPGYPDLEGSSQIQLIDVETLFVPKSTIIIIVFYLFSFFFYVLFKKNISSEVRFERKFSGFF